METMKFPFSDAPNTACFTCCRVLEENKPILYVSQMKMDIGSSYVVETIRKKMQEWFH